MGVIYTITIRGMRLNKKRTFLTILTIILSVGMMTAVLCGAWSMLGFLQEKEKAYGGDYEYYIENISMQEAQDLWQNENVADVSLLSFVGNSFYGEEANKSLIAIAGVNQSFIENFVLSKYLVNGRYPVDESEIVLSESFLENNELSLSVGDEISLIVGSRVWDEIDATLYGMTNYMGSRESFYPAMEKTYSIVGIISDTGGSQVAGNFNAFTGLDKSDTSQELTAYVKCERISKAIYTQAPSNAQFNSSLLLYYGVTNGKGSVKIMSAVAVVILLLMLASSAIISNVLSISLQERIKQLGLLSSIGATKRQKRASIRFEAFLLGIVGIPLGLIVGVVLALIVLALIRASFQAVFADGMVILMFHTNAVVLFLCALTGIVSLIFAGKAPCRIAGKANVIDILRQSNTYKLKIKKSFPLFGIYGALASKNIHRNPKRFRAITGSIFLAVVIGLSMYSLSDFMIYQTSMDMREDGSCYTDVVTTLQYKELPNAVKALSDENISADISYCIEKYVTTTVEENQINPDMAGYFFIGGNTAELYVVGLDNEHFNEFFPNLVVENGGVLVNSTIGNYGVHNNRMVAGSPFQIESGSTLSLNFSDDRSSEIIVQEVINDESAMFHSLFVRDRAILLLPLSYFEGELDGDTYLSLNISTSQHKETAQCLTDMGYFGTMDVSSETENLRQVYMILKLSICIFAMLMIAIIGLNVCNTMSNTIYVRRGEFAVLRSVGMTTKGLMKMLLLEATLYGIKALLPALAVSFAVHYILYYLICTGMTPFVFYINWGVYGVAIVAVCVIVVVAMMFSAGNVRKMDIITALSFG